MKKQVLLMALLLTGTTLSVFAEQPMVGMKMQKKSEQASHQGTGKVVSVDRAKLRIKLAHEPIKSLDWPGMTMEFSVARAALLDGIKEGDAVQFELGKTKPEDSVWVIVKINRK